MFQLHYDDRQNLVTAITIGEYDAVLAKEQMHQIIAIPELVETVRILRIFKQVTFNMTTDEVREHFAYVQKCLDNTHIKNCFLAVVVDTPINTALGFLYRANQLTGKCQYVVNVFSTEKAATQWLMEN